MYRNIEHADTVGFPKSIRTPECWKASNSSTEVDFLHCITLYSIYSYVEGILYKLSVYFWENQCLELIRNY